MSQNGVGELLGRTRKKYRTFARKKYRTFARKKYRTFALMGIGSARPPHRAGWNCYSHSKLFFPTITAAQTHPPSLMFL